MKVVCSGLPFQRISDWELNPVPFTISKTGTAFAEMVSGDSDVRRITASVQLLKSMIAVHVHADSKAVRTRTRLMRQGLQRLMRQVHTDASGR